MANTIVESLFADPVSPSAGQMWFRADLVAGFIPAVPTTGFSVAAGDTKITLTVGSAGGATSYNAYYTSNGTNPVIGGGATTKLTGVANAQEITGLVNGTAYKLAFTSVGVNGESVLGAVLNATPESAASPTTFDQDFLTTVDFATDPHLASVVSGGGTVSQDTNAPGYVTTSSTTNQTAFIYDRHIFSLASVFTARAKGMVPGGGADNPMLLFHWFAGEPTAIASGSLFRAFMLNAYYQSETIGKFNLWYWDSSAVLQYYNGSAWVAGSGAASQTVGFDIRSSSLVYEITGDGTNIRFAVYQSDGTTLIVQSTPVAISSIYNPGGKDLYLIIGDLLNNAWASSIKLDSITVA